jgi:hypothetical protein
MMLLISFVALLGLVNGVFADDIHWIGTGSFCDPCNWDGGVVPGPDDEAVIDCEEGGGDIVIDCDFTVDRLHGPAYEGDCNQAMNIVSGTFLATDRWRAAMEGDGIGWVNWTGGTGTCDGEMRVNDDAKRRAYFNMRGSSVLIVNDRVRSGDSGGNDNQTHWTFTGDAIVSVGGSMRIGDDGGGSFTVSGNASITIGEDLYFVGREMSKSVDISGNCEIYVGGDFKLGNPGQAAGKAPTTVTMTMAGGTLNAENVLLGWEPYVPADFSSTVDMSGGLIVVRRCLRIGEKTTVSCTGGEIRLESGCLEIADGGNIDICGGVLKIKGNVLADIAVMVCEGNGILTGCGHPLGIVAEYDGGWTIVTGTWPGPPPDQAACPRPCDGAERVSSRGSVAEPGVKLCWMPGCRVGSRGRHLVYFGSDCDAVWAAGPGDPENVCVNRAYELCCNVGVLPLWQCFCWRVDEFNQDGTTTMGNIWSFCTGCEDIPGDCNRDCVLNFEDYAATVDDFGKQIYWP